MEETETTGRKRSGPVPFLKCFSNKRKSWLSQGRGVLPALSFARSYHTQRGNCNHRSTPPLVKRWGSERLPAMMNQIRAVSLSCWLLGDFTASNPRLRLLGSCLVSWVNQSFPTPVKQLSYSFAARQFRGVRLDSTTFFRPVPFAI